MEIGWRHGKFLLFRCSDVTPAPSEDDAVDSETPSPGVDGLKTDQKGPPAATEGESG
jgi:hypothetical protein